MKILPTLIAALALLPLGAHAQDKIYRKHGDVIEAKVKEVQDNSVLYKRFDNPDGPDYVISKREIKKIVYQGGQTDEFSDNNTKSPRRPSQAEIKRGPYPKKYGENILSVTPGAYLVALDGTINDAGIGITYERMLDDHGHISLNLPIMMHFSSSRDYTNNYYGYGISGDFKSYNSFLFMPGVKFYPAPDREMVRYSLGASFFAMLGGEPYAVYVNNSSYSGNPQDTWHYSMYGIVLSNSVNISATRHLYLALDLSGGIPFSDNRRQNNSSYIDVPFSPWIQFGFKCGYRF